MSKKDSLLKGAEVTCFTGVMSLLLALAALQLGVYGYTAIETDTIASVSLLVFTVSTVVGTGLMVIGYFSFTPDHRLYRAHDTIERQSTRLLVDESSGKKILICGMPGRTVRDALLGQRQVDPRLLRDGWSILDSHHDNVTDKTLCESDAVLRLVFH